MTLADQTGALPPPEPPRRRLSTAGKLTGLLALGLACFVGLVAAIDALAAWQVGDPGFSLPRWIAYLAAAAIVLPLVARACGALLGPQLQTVRALSDGIRSFRDHDFSVRLATTRRDELGDLVRLYNRVGEILQEERGQIRQRELLLQTALDRSPVAIVLVNALDRVIYANPESRRLFMGGSRLQGRRFEEVLRYCPEEMRQVLDGGSDGLFSVDSRDEPETYHVSQRRFLLNRRNHTLYQVRRMTAELARQEVEIWKKVIRIISHELNNSLAPISSLAHSAARIARMPDPAERLEPIYASIRERVDHLSAFLEGYARFARLPRPAAQTVDWREWLEAPRKMYGFKLIGEPPTEPGHFDPAQVQQVLINLLKNAREASNGGDIEVRIDRLPDGRARVQVLDRGRGMTEEVMRRALLPFYSTKQSGAGVGLPLCREILEAHGGGLRIQSRKGGGTVVSFWLPPPR